MSIVRKSISLTEHQDAWVKAQISAGDYTNDSEVVRDLIRKAQANDENLHALRAAVQKGRDSKLGSRTMAEIKTDTVNKLKADGSFPP